ncbi:MAG: TA system VapC family ribonuclease toxin [Bryobacteraceae bacterium]|jgi:toxin-antitoxin system PIN domain toxin
MTCLPDVNVWIALVVEQHIHHAAARRWFEEAQDDSLAFCRVTQTGFMSLLTNPRVMAEDALTPSRAWQLLDMFYEDSRILFAAEPPGLEASWRVLTKARVPGANFWTDAYLAAFASAAGHTLVTFDRSFHRFDKLKLRWLVAGP